MEVSGKLYVPLALNLEESRDTNWIGDWVALIAGLDVLEICV
jgi:hypothetical protein